MRKYILCAETFLTLRIFFFQSPKNNEVPEYIFFTARIFFLAPQLFLSQPRKHFRVPRKFFHIPRNFFPSPEIFLSILKLLCHLRGFLFFSHLEHAVMPLLGK